MSSVAEFFDLKARGSTVPRELRGAVATFLTMADILFANPTILKNAGVPFESAEACTAFLMAGQIARIDFQKLETAIPAFVTLVALPFTYSIAHGIGYGFITFVVIKVCLLRFREVHPLMYGVAGVRRVFGPGISPRRGAKTQRRKRLGKR